MPSITSDADEAVSVITDGATVLIGGFGTAGQPMERARLANVAVDNRSWWDFT